MFGKIVGADSISARARMELNDAGKMTYTLFRKTINEYKNVFMISHIIIMPNHFHGIVSISRADMESAPTLSAIIQSFKRNTTIKYINGVKSGIYPPFNKRIWQRSYHDHIIRNESEYQYIWQYIDENPLKWEEDSFYAV